MISLLARDFNNRPQPRGKQSQRYENFWCVYTRTTGIWQTVWMEPVSVTYLGCPRLTPDTANGIIHLVQPISGNLPGVVLHARLSDQHGEICQARCKTSVDLVPSLYLFIPEERRHYWSMDDPYLCCYTQLTDVHQEQNRIYDFQRQPKFDIQKLANIQQQKAAIEKSSLPIP